MRPWAYARQTPAVNNRNVPMQLSRQLCHSCSIFKGSDCACTSTPDNACHLKQCCESTNCETLRPSTQMPDQEFCSRPPLLSNGSPSQTLNLPGNSTKQAVDGVQTDVQTQVKHQHSLCNDLISVSDGTSLSVHQFLLFLSLFA